MISQSTPAERAAARRIATAPQRAAWVDMSDDDVWDENVNQVASNALLAALMLHHSAGDAINGR